MPAPAEAHMRSNVGPVQHKPVRVVEHGGIAVGGAVCDGDGDPGLDGLAAQHRLLGYRPREPAVGAEQPHELLDGRRDQAEILPQLLLQLLILRQVVADAAEHQRRRHHPDYQALPDAASATVLAVAFHGILTREKSGTYTRWTSSSGSPLLFLSSSRLLAGSSSGSRGFSLRSASTDFAISYSCVL